MSSAEDALEQAEGKSISESTEQGFSSIILAILGGIAALSAAFFENLSDVFAAFGAARDFIVALITNPIIILDMTSRFTGESLTSGIWADLGPLSFAAGVFAIAAGWYVWDATDAEIPIVGPIIKRLTFWREDTDDETS